MTDEAKKTPKIRLSFQDEQDIQCLLVDRHPCPYRVYSLKLGWVVDQKCPIRKIVRREFEKLMAEREHEKNEKEYPDEV